MYYWYIQILEIFIHTMTVLILVSGFRGFKVGFNSLCAFASVNHLHLHAYYLEHDLFVDTCVSGLTMSLLLWVPGYFNQEFGVVYLIIFQKSFHILC